MDKADGGNAYSAVEAAIAAANRQWRAMGVVESDRAALTDDLRVELTAAAADGVALTELIGDDVRGFARDLAISAGARRVPYEFRRLLLTALVGAVPGLALAWLLIWRWWWWPMLDMDSLPQQVALYAVCALVTLLGALYAVHRRMRGEAAIGRTVLAMAVLVPVAGALSVPVTMGFASLTGYSLALPVLAVETAIVGGALAGATVLARRWALAPTLGSVPKPAAGGRPEATPA
jgi:hypothetical protein